MAACSGEEAVGARGQRLWRRLTTLWILRWAAARHAALREHLALGRRLHRDWIARVFATDLEPLGAKDRQAALDALVVATDVYTWKLLRRDMGRGMTATQATNVGMIRWTLTAYSPADATPPPGVGRPLAPSAGKSSNRASAKAVTSRGAVVAVDRHTPSQEECRQDQDRVGRVLPGGAGRVIGRGREGRGPEAGQSPGRG